MLESIEEQIINRAYYSIYHAISAIHALNGKAYKRDKDSLGNFNKEYIKMGIFPRTLGRRIAEAEEIRHASDYDDFYIATKEEAEDKFVPILRVNQASTMVKFQFRCNPRLVHHHHRKSRWDYGLDSRWDCNMRVWTYFQDIPIKLQSVE